MIACASTSTIALGPAICGFLVATGISTRQSQEAVTLVSLPFPHAPSKRGRFPITVWYCWVKLELVEVSGVFSWRLALSVRSGDLLTPEWLLAARVI